jgi:hypothetical protein
MEVDELMASFRAVTMCDSRAAVAAMAAISPPATMDYDEPAMGEEVCTLRVRFPDGWVTCKSFGAARPTMALFRYCHSVLMGGGAAMLPPFRLVKLAGGATEEIHPDQSSSLQDLGLHQCTLHLVFFA